MCRSSPERVGCFQTLVVRAAQDSVLCWICVRGWLSSFPSLRIKPKLSYLFVKQMGKEHQPRPEENLYQLNEDQGDGQEHRECLPDTMGALRAWGRVCALASSHWWIDVFKQTPETGRDFISSTFEMNIISTPYQTLALHPKDFSFFFSDSFLLWFFLKANLKLFILGY